MLEKILEEKIRTAIENGEFENLRGAGKPLDLDEYFAAPAEVRVGYALLKDQDFVPREVELINEIAGLKDRLKTCADDERPELTKLINERSVALAMILERNKRRR